MTKKLLLLAALSLLWGSEWIANLEISELPHLRVIALRCLLAALFLLPFAWQQRRRSPAPAFGRNVVAYGRNALLGLGILAVPALLSDYAANISSGLAVVLFAAMPLIATLMEGGTGIAGAPYMLGGLLGIAFLVRGSLSFSSTQGLSILWIVLAVLCVAASMVRAKHWLQGQNLFASIVVQMLSAAAAIGMDSLFQKGAAGVFTVRQGVVIALLAIAGTAGAYTLFYSLLHGMRASQLSVVQWLTPVIGVLEAAVSFRHFPSYEKMAALVLILACAVLMLRMRTEDTDATSGEHLPLTLKITML